MLPLLAALPLWHTSATCRQLFEFVPSVEKPLDALYNWLSIAQ